MAEFILSTALPLIGTFSVGALGWLLTHFALNPILRFYRMRERALEVMEYNANVFSRETDEKGYDDAIDEIRRLGVQLRALHHASNRIFRWYFGRFGYNPKAAGSALIGFSNSLSDKSGGKAGNRWDAEKALNLPLNSKERPKLRE